MTPHSRSAVAWRDMLTVLLSCEAVAVLAWLAPASIAIVQWPADGPRRVALLAPAWQLGMWGLAGFALALGLVWLAKRRAPESALSLDHLAPRLAPLMLTWLATVPYLPWIPDRWPLLLILSGPLMWVVAAVAVAMVAKEAIARALATVERNVGRRAVLIASLVVYVGWGLYSAHAVGAGGDEPHYLIITESLIRDGDLKIDNNHRQGDYRSFFSGELRPDFFERGTDGEIYSIHAPGLPALLIPAYAAGGRLGAVAFMGLLAALTALAMFDLADAIAGRKVALVTWAACGLTVPFLPHAWLIFPEIPGALITAWAALWVWQPIDRSVWRWVLRALAIALLPWLHTKFAVLLAFFATALALRLLRSRLRLLAFVVPIGISIALWFDFFHRIYGSWNPEAPYGDYSRIYVLTRYIPHGLIGILFDQKFGLLFYSPIYLAAAVGAWLLLRRRDTCVLGAVVTLAAGAFVISTARLYMFWGGSSAPARFLVPILPCLAPMLAVAVQGARSVWTRSAVATSLVVSLGMAVAGVLSPTALMLFSDPHGRARLLERLQAGSPLALTVPTFTEPTWSQQVAPLALWCVVAVLGIIAARVAPRRLSTGTWGSAVAGGIVSLVGASIISATPDASVRAATARRGALDTLARFDGDRFRTLDYGTFARTSPAQLNALTTFSLEVMARANGNPALTQAVVIPPGLYEAVVHFVEAPPASAAELTIADAPSAVFARASTPFESPTRLGFAVPMTTRRLTVNTTDVALAGAVAAIDIVPRQIVPPSQREPLPVRAIEAVPDFPGAFLGYTDEHAYPEGGVFWTRGMARTQVVVSTVGASRLALTLSTGPRSGAVNVSVGDIAHTVDMKAGEEQVIRFPVPAGARLVTLSVQSTVMFRPAEEDFRSTDMRGLGCQVRVALE